MNVDRQALIVAAFGGSGSGKSYFLKRLVKKMRPARLVIVDPHGEYDGHGPLVDNCSAIVKALAKPTYSVRLHSSHNQATRVKQFSLVCNLIRWQVDPRPGQGRPASCAPVVFLVDELADFVGASFAQSPDSWQWILRSGRKYGVSTLAASQRPQMIDKTLTDLATLIRVGRLNNGSSHAVLSDSLGVKAAQLAALVDTQWIALDKNTGQLASDPPHLVDRPTDRQPAIQQGRAGDTVAPALRRASPRTKRK